MVREIMLYTSNDLRDFMHLACASPLDIGVHTMDNQIADGKSVLGLMAIDYKKPVKVVSEMCIRDRRSGLPLCTDSQAKGGGDRYYLCIPPDAGVPLDWGQNHDSQGWG